MKKFALLAATLICFAGCARNDTETTAEGYDPATETTAAGTAGTAETGQDSDLSNPGSTTSPSPGLDPTGSPAIGGNTNTLGDTNAMSNTSTNTNSLNRLPPEPMPPGAGILEDSGQGTATEPSGTESPQPDNSAAGSNSQPPQ